MTSMRYRVKEVYATLQGEGYHAGRPAVFLRFAGCNLWSGREADRSSAVCRFCDTDFVGIDGPNGGSFTADELTRTVAGLWNPQPFPALRTAFGGQSDAPPTPMVVCTGGEPLLQLDAPLVAALHQAGMFIAIETNGTRPLPVVPAGVPGIDWVCMSPKAHAPLMLTAGDELKLVYPQPDLPPEQVEHLDFRHFFLQPMDGPHAARNADLAADYCRRHPRWRLSIQTHKVMGIP
jgi:7-carboxy-7-deazaguanine synthase